MRYLIYLSLLLLNTNSFAKDFVIYDSIGQTGKPDLSNYGLKPIKVVNSQFIWKDVKKMDEPELKAIDLYIQKMNSQNIICLDVEHWPLHNEDKYLIDINIEKLITIFNRFKSSMPDSKIGYYGILPIRDYWTPIKNNPEKLKLWNQSNDYLYPLANKMDVIFPSLYTFYTDKEKWLIYAKANINQARKYNKPVIVFIWPQYHTSNRFNSLDFIDNDYWRLQLETTYELADGVVIWTPAGKMKSRWDESAEWWKTTIQFIESKRLKQ